MNRRVPVKKNYFAFLSGLVGSKTLRMAIYFVIGLAVIVLAWFIFAAQDVDASTIFAGVVLLLLPLLILAALLFGFKKLTGLSWIQGVEWVGAKTLLLIDWLIGLIKSDFSSKKKTPPEVEPKATAKLEPVEQEVAAVSTEKLEPSLGFATLDSSVNPEQDLSPSLDALHEEIKLSEEPAVVEDTTPIFLSNISEATIEEEEDDDDFIEEPPFEGAPSFDLDDDTDIIELVDVQYDEPEQTSVAIEKPRASVEQTVIVKSSFEPQVTPVDRTVENFSPTRVTEQKDEELDLTPASNMAQASVEPEPVVGSDLINEQFELAVKLPNIEPIGQLDSDVNPVIEEPELAENSAETNSEQAFRLGSEVLEESESGNEEIDEVEQELKSLFQEEEGYPLASAAGMEQEMLEIKNEQPHLNVDLNSLNDNATDVGVTSLNSGSDEATTEANNTLYSMLYQAEEQASGILSSFTDKLSQSLGFQVNDEEEVQAQAVEEVFPEEYHLPAIDLLQVHQHTTLSYSVEQLEAMSRSVERVLKDYKVESEVVGAYPGPIITRFELLLAPGVKVSRVSGLAKDLARAMLVTSVRVVEIIEGTPYIGLEIPNKERELVSFREILASEQFLQAKSPLTLALGKDVSGDTVVYDLAKMPHLLVAGTTGSGKSVAINTMILSLLYKSTPEQVRMIMVDPKMLELSVYDGIPHLLTPVVTDMKEAQNALRWAVAEMERRYKLMAKVGVRGLEGFNQKINEAAERGETIRDPLYQSVDALAEGEDFPVLSTLPSIVIVIDELADMMMIVGKKVEELIARLAQKARAAGIHLVLATQRPSVDVLTGLIKANVPTRISFQVSSRIDSRTILDQGGAEALLGNGDMLFLPSGRSVPTRAHGAFVADEEVHSIVNYLKTQRRSDYLTEIVQEEPAESTVGADASQETVDELYPDAVSFVLETGKASISSVQRRFKVGYNRAARMIDQMEEERIVSEPEGNGSRRVLNRDE